MCPYNRYLHANSVTNLACWQYGLSLVTLMVLRTIEFPREAFDFSKSSVANNVKELVSSHMP